MMKLERWGQDNQETVFGRAKDVRVALSACPNSLAASLVMAVHLGDMSSLVWLSRGAVGYHHGPNSPVGVMRGHWESACVENGWNSDPIVSAGLFELAVLEVVAPEKCTACGGRGEVRNVQRESRRCERCAGLRTSPRSATECARFIGRDESAWRRTYAPQLVELKLFVEGQLAAGEQAVREYLS